VKRGTLALVVPAAVVAMCLGACSPMHTGAAATVGSTRISVTDLNAAVQHDLTATDATSSGSSAAPDRTTAAVQASLTTLIDDDLLADAATAKGITVSETDIQSVLATQRQTNGTDEATAKANGIPFADLHQVVHQAVLIDKLEAAVGKGATDQTVLGQLLQVYLASIAKQQGVSVNPRYGVWQASKLSVGDGDPFTSSQSPAASSPVS
jgi:SurA N-terminal domain